MPSNVAREAKPVLAGYVLEKVAKGDEFIITELNGVDKFKAFYLSGFIDLGFFQAHHFQVRTAMAMANTIRVYKITIPWKLSRLNEVYDAITVHCSTVGAGKGSNSGIIMVTLCTYAWLIVEDPEDRNVSGRKK